MPTQNIAELLNAKLVTLSNASYDTYYFKETDLYTFRSSTTAESYTTMSSDITLIKPILKARDLFLNYTLSSTLDNSNNINFILEKEKENIIATDPKDNRKFINIIHAYINNPEALGKELEDTNNYENLFKKYKGIRNIFIEAVNTGVTEFPRAISKDFIQLELYQNKETKTLILLANYVLLKKFQNKYGMLTGMSRPNDCNHLILLGLAPAFLPEVKERLTENEINFFKLLTTPTKLYHESSSAELYMQILSDNIYNKIIKEYKMDQLETQLKVQEENNYVTKITQAKQIVEDLTNSLTIAETTLLNAEKDLIYYRASDYKIKDILDYILGHKYLIDFDYIAPRLKFKFRVPLAQWDPEIADTLLKGIERDASRYTDKTAYVKNIKDFIKNILIKQEAIYYMLANFSINLNTFDWQIDRIYNTSYDTSPFKPDKLLEYKAGVNPHLEYHSCVGTYKIQIEKAVQRKDIIGLMESILAPFKNWNLSDGIVNGKMFIKIIPGLIDYKIPCVEYKGEMISLQDLQNKLEPVVESIPVETTVKKKRTPRARVIGTVTDREVTDEEVTLTQRHIIGNAVDTIIPDYYEALGTLTDTELEQRLQAQAIEQMEDENNDN